MAGKKKQKQKIEMKVKPIKGRTVLAIVDGEPVAEIDKLTARTKKEKKTVYLTGDPQADDREKSIRIHHNKSDAISRFSKRFPKITPRFKKLI